jgi:hypothetical protein
MEPSPCIKPIRVLLFAFLLGVLVAGPARGGEVFFDVFYELEFTELNLSGGPYPMPLGSDPGNNLGDSIEGYGFVDSDVSITLSSSRDVNPGPVSFGQAYGYKGQTHPNGLLVNPAPIDPAVLDGELFVVDSFFDVFSTSR